MPYEINLGRRNAHGAPECRINLKNRKAFALPVNFQPDMFTDRMPIDDRAYEEGIAAGLQGKDPTAPYDETSGPGQRFLAGWHEGQRQMREELQTAMTKRNSANAAAELIKGGEDPDFDVDEQDEAA